MYDWSTVKEEFTHSAKVGRTVIKNWSKIQQRAVHVIGYTTTESYHNSGGTSWEIGLEGEVKQADDSDDGKTDDAFCKKMQKTNYYPKNVLPRAAIIFSSFVALFFSQILPHCLK